MRPLFAIAPLALAFVLLGPTTTDATSAASPSLAAKVWHLVFDRDGSGGTSPSQVKPASSLTEASALNR
ncbi:hypothetical protein [Aquabacterium sp.]|uniref:hypothetical protein n=1 Tax=Aquabacterium sp. TaxID=1872578 RepID=UPI003D6D2732